MAIRFMRESQAIDVEINVVILPERAPELHAFSGPRMRFWPIPGEKLRPSKHGRCYWNKRGFG
jgi:hypothetical protein